MERTVLVVSDFHMGAGRLNDFEPEVERHFASFLDRWRRHAGAVELVINGDLLDFVQAPPSTGRHLESESATGEPLCFTEQQSVDKLRAIAKEHVVAFEALRDFLSADSTKSVTILPGNHDADFFWPGVRMAFTGLVCGSDDGAAERLRFHLETVYRPALHEHLWIEHGHRFDPINRFTVRGYPCWSEAEPPIFATPSGERRLYECVGTRFLIRFLNALDETYPLVDNVKPFSRFLRLFGASALAPGYGPLKVAVVVATMIRYVGQSIREGGSDLLEPESRNTQDLERALKAAVASASPHEVAAFTDALAKAGFLDGWRLSFILDDPDSAGELSAFLAEHLAVLDTLGDREPDEVLELAKGFSVDDTDDLRRAAEDILDNTSNACQYVTMGHTHLAVHGDRYLNTGSWTRYYEYDAGEPLSPWSMLGPESAGRFPYELNFVESHRGQTPLVALRTWKDRPKS